MTKDDATRFLMALQNCAPFVPPMFFAQITGSPVARFIEQVANAEATTAAPVDQIERPKPHVVS